MKIETWFPTSIAIVENVISKKEHNFLKNKIIKLNKEAINLHWHSGVKTSYGKYDLIFDKNFDNLIERTRLHTIDFAKTMGSHAGYKVKQSWYTIYKEGDFQEYHAHDNSIFSSVYCFTNPKNSGKLIFKNPVKDMLPMGRVKANQYSFYNVMYKLKPGQLVIFRSYLDHSVDLCKNKTPRITMACNIS
tara:strand:- start:1224 stop:1790 length:567 start_codon:yes stop_codon:yes gene_type:complete